MTKRTKIIVLLVILGFTFYCLFVQPELLGISISKSLNFPLGSLISWGGVVSFVLISHLIIIIPTESKLYKIYKILKGVHVCLSLVWLPVSYALSGNLAFTFQNKENLYNIWIYYTLVILLFPIILILLKVFNKSRK